jgi:hypothetical protein
MATTANPRSCSTLTGRFFGGRPGRRRVLGSGNSFSISAQRWQYTPVDAWLRTQRFPQPSQTFKLIRKYVILISPLP